MEEVKTEKKVEEVKDLNAPAELTPDAKMVEAIKGFDFLRYENGGLVVNHEELKEILKLKILKMGDISKRGAILANLNGGSSNIDPDTLILNSCMSTVQVGFDAFKFNLLEVTDTNLIMGLYAAVVSYNNFFRKTPLGIIL
jgi:hypothetical protein